jgi:membrane protease YdiL (CAAX protease family)
MSFDTLFVLTLVILLGAVFPLLGIRDFRVLLHRTRAGDTNARVKFYKSVFAWEWPMAIGLLAWWLLSGNTLASVGLSPVAEGSQWVAIGIGLLVTATQVIGLTLRSQDSDALSAIPEQMGEVINLAARTPNESRLFDMVAVTAGVCEEILYRGLLLAALLPLAGTWPAVGISSVIFGLGHAYQGMAGIVKTGLVGLVLAMLTVSSGSLFVAIVLHTTMDLVSGRMMGKAVRMSPPTVLEGSDRAA